VLSSNLCRCTGYQNIIKAVKAARDEMRASAPTARA
jgi:aerobic carbon-monoxide dehydrogenase small subunit